MRARAQRGAIMLAAVMLILLAGFIAVALAYLSVANTASGEDHLRSAQALFTADGGLERALYRLLAPTTAQRVACAAVPETQAVVAGEFTLAAEAGSPFYPAAAPTLTAALPAATASPILFLPVSSLAGLAPYGRLMIDRESFDYESTGAVAADCGGGAAPCLRNVTRARDQTIAAAHAAGTRIGQFQCNVRSTGSVPTAAAPQGQRILHAGVQMQEGWIVGDSPNPGDATTGRAIVLRWNGFTWSNVSAGLPARANQNLLGVSVLSYADAWAVGQTGGGGAGACTTNRARIIGWNGNAWGCAASPIGEHLNGVSLVSATDGWAVGDRTANSGNGWVFLRWNGATWNNFPLNTNPVRASNLNGIHMLNANEGWAVGDQNNNGGGCGNTGRILRWTGVNWACVASPSVEGLNAVYMLDTDGDGVADDGWAVGRRVGAGANQWTLVRWNGVVWANVAATTGVAAQHLRSVYCNNASDCWAVGNRQGCANPGLTVLRWNGANWACQAGLPVVDRDLNAVACFHAADCWAAGDRGTIIHWDGASWTIDPQSGVATTENLNAISLVGARQTPRAAWQEVFP